MAVVGPEYQLLIYADIGLNGRKYGREAWAQRLIEKALGKNTLNLTKPKPLMIPLIFVLEIMLSHWHHT